MKLVLILAVSLLTSLVAQATEFTVKFVPDAATVAAVAPVGTISMFAGIASSVPAGWRLANGDALSKAEYPALYAVIADTYLVAGTDAQHFNLPNTQGVFVRGVGSSVISGVPYAGTLGAYQNDQFKSHNHNTVAGVANDIGYGLAAGYNTGLNALGFTNNVQAANGYGTPWSLGITATGGSETNPANLSVYYMIKVN